MNEAIPMSEFWTMDDLRKAFADDDMPRARAIAGVLGGVRMAEEGQAEARALIAAGWTFELSDHDLMVYQWSWRRPPKRPGKPGRLFPSTGQAYNAMRREQTDAK